LPDYKSLRDFCSLSGLNFAVPVFGAGFDDFDFGGGEVEEAVDMLVDLDFQADDTAAIRDGRAAGGSGNGGTR
jgi:hypothetical protein